METTGTTTRRRGRPRKNATPDLPTVATHGTTIDHSQVLDALQTVDGFPLPPIKQVMQWSQQVRAEVLRWVNHTQRDTEPLPAALDAWLTQHSKIIPMPTVETTEELQFSEETAEKQAQEQTSSEEHCEEKSDQPSEGQPSEGWLLEDRPWTKGAKETNNLTVPIHPDRAVELMNEQAEAYRELSRLKNRKKEVDSELNAQIKKTESKLSELTDAVLHGQETTSVECQWEYDYTNGVKRLIRLDTGVIVEHGTLNEKERQMRLQLEENTHVLDAEAQPESERDRLVAECVRKAFEIRPALKALYDNESESCGYQSRPDGWPYNPQPEELHTWSDDELSDFQLMLKAIESAHADGNVSGWITFLPDIPEDAITDCGEDALDRYWRKADDNLSLAGKLSQQSLDRFLQDNMPDERLTKIQEDERFISADPEIKALFLTLYQTSKGDCPDWSEVNEWSVGTIEEVQNWLTYGKGDVPEVLKSYVWTANKPEEAAVTQQEAARSSEEGASEPEAVEEVQEVEE